VGIFRRGTKDTNNALGDPADSLEPAGPSDSLEPAGPSDPQGAQPDSAATGGEKHGPFDRSDVEGLDGRLDLGSLWLTGVPGLELRLEVEQESQNVVGVTAVLGESAVQLQAFAAPRVEKVSGATSAPRSPPASPAREARPT